MKKDFFRRLFQPRRRHGKDTLRSKFMTSFHDVVIFVLVFAISISISGFVSWHFRSNTQFSIPVFILAVTLIARFTQGYGWGVAASVLGVLSANIVFTPPFWVFDMSSAAEYPLTFGVMLVVSLIISTLTSQIKLQEELKIAMRMEQMRSNLLRAVSHDLRTPLTAIIGSSSVLMEDEGLSPERKNELLAEINKDARWLVRVTENILSITRFSGGKVHLHMEDEVVEEIVSSAIVKFRRNHPEITVSVDRPEEILLVPMDATLIEQVLINLFDNAAAHGGHVQNIRVSIATIGNRASVTVLDDGVGIPEDVLPELFDGIRFSQSDDGRHMGIGLSVCRSIIHAHGGTITARNGANGGASFRFKLPF